MKNMNCNNLNRAQTILTKSKNFIDNDTRRHEKMQSKDWKSFAKEVFDL